MQQSDRAHEFFAPSSIPVSFGDQHELYANTYTRKPETANMQPRLQPMEDKHV